MKKITLNFPHFSSNAKLFLFAQFLHHLGLAIYSLLYGLYLRESGVSVSQVGLVFSSNAYGAALVTFLAIFILDKLTLKSLMLVCLSFSCLGYLAQIFSFVPETRVLSGLVYSASDALYLISFAPFIIQNSSTQNRIALFSLSASLAIMASFIGHAAGGYLPRLFLGLYPGIPKTTAYQWGLVVSVFCMILSIVPIMKIDQDKKIAHALKYWERFRSYDWSLFGKILLPKFCIGIGAGLIIPYMNLYLKEVFHLKTEHIGLSFSVLEIFLFSGTLAAPLLVAKFGKINSIIGTACCSIPFMAILGFTRFLPLALFAFFMRGMLMNMSAPISSMVEMELAEENQQKILNSLISFVWSLGWAMSVHVGGQIIEKHSFESSFYVAIFFYLAFILLYYLIFKRSSLAKRIT